MSAPLVVNTTDGAVFTRRTVVDGRALYAIAGAPDDCPKSLMATLDELAEHGIAGTSDALPMPMGGAPC